MEEFSGPSVLYQSKYIPRICKNILLLDKYTIDSEGVNEFVKEYLTKKFTLMILDKNPAVNELRKTVKHYFVYFLICPKISKIRYVGISKDPLYRFNDHLRNEESENTHKRNWINSLYREGLFPILKIVACRLTFMEAGHIEDCFILHYREKLGKGVLTNAARGGGCMRITYGDDHWTRKDPEKLEKFRLASIERCKDLEVRRKMSESMKGIKKSNTDNIKAAAQKRAKDPLWREKLSKLATMRGYSGAKNPMYGKKRPEVGVLNKELNSIPVAKIKDGVEVARYDSSVEAEKETGTLQSNIRFSCKNPSKTAGGFHWKYLSEEYREFYSDKQFTTFNDRKVLQLDLQHNVIAEHRSLKEASEKTGIGRSGICSCISGTYKTCGGFKWQYASE